MKREFSTGFGGVKRAVAWGLRGKRAWLPCARRPRLVVRTFGPREAGAKVPERAQERRSARRRGAPPGGCNDGLVRAIGAPHTVLTQRRDLEGGRERLLPGGCLDRPRGGVGSHAGGGRMRSEYPPRATRQRRGRCLRRHAVSPRPPRPPRNPYKLPMFLARIRRMLNAEPSGTGCVNVDSVEALVFEPTQNSRTLQRGVDEALACRDMLAAAPAKPSRIARLIAAFVALAPPAPRGARFRFGPFGRSRAHSLLSASPLDTQRHGGSQ